MAQDGNYEVSEQIALRDGKAVLAQKANKWLSERKVNASGFFFDLIPNPIIHPNHLKVVCVDGVGTKLFTSAWSGNYALTPIDAIAMNANDMATGIHVMPDTTTIYLACQDGVEVEHMGEIMDGFAAGLSEIRIENYFFKPVMGKLETASLDEMIALGIRNKGVDFGVVMDGWIEVGKVPKLNPQAGDYIMGIGSTGMHSNGYTGGRHVLIRPSEELESNPEWRKQYHGRFSLNDKPEGLEGQTLLEALQTPTAIYMKDAAVIAQSLPDNRHIYGVNITGNGFKNFNRAGHGVAFEITDPLEPKPIHKLLVEESGWNAETAYKKQNMGMGFAFVVRGRNNAEWIANQIDGRQGRRAQIVGEVVESPESELVTRIHNAYGAKPNEVVELRGY